MLDLLEHVHLVGAGLLVGVEDDVLALGNAVGIHGHALEVVVAIHQNPHLRVVGVAQVQIGYTPANLDDTVLADAALIAVADVHPAGVDAGRVLTLPVSEASVVGVVIHDGLNLAHLLVNILLRDLGAGEDNGVGLLAWIGHLGNAAAINVVTLVFKDHQRFPQL